MGWGSAPTFRSSYGCQGASAPPSFGDRASGTWRAAEELRDRRGSKFYGEAWSLAVQILLALASAVRLNPCILHRNGIPEGWLKSPNPRKGRVGSGGRFVWGWRFQWDVTQAALGDLGLPPCHGERSRLVLVVDPEREQLAGANDVTQTGGCPAPQGASCPQQGQAAGTAGACRGSAGSSRDRRSKPGAAEREVENTASH